MIDLPPPLKGYFDAANGGDADAIAATFAQDARVGDEGREHLGRDQIRDWAAAARRKYSFRAEPFAAEGGDDRPIVRAHVSGDFPGSPVDLTYRFQLAGGAIARLQIG